MLFCRFFNEDTVLPLVVSYRAPAGRIVANGGCIALGGKIDVTVRPCIVKTVDAASVVLKEVMDAVIGVVFGMGTRNGTL